MTQQCTKPEGMLLVNKAAGTTSFRLVTLLRRRLGVQKIGHAGTLDPFATGVMVMLIGRRYTRLSQHFLQQDKEYVARIKLGITTDTYDCDGSIIEESAVIPTTNALKEASSHFQGTISQIPPMFSAKKVNGKKLYELARKGQEVERKPVEVVIKTDIVDYAYPFLDIKVNCSKGTYIRSIAHDMGILLGCGGHLTTLQRTRSGPYQLEECVDGALLEDPAFDVTSQLRQLSNATMSLANG